MNNIKGYIRLCAAIVNSGIEQHDVPFLQSNWCEYLVDSVVTYHNNKCTDSSARYTPVVRIDNNWR